MARYLSGVVRTVACRGVDSWGEMAVVLKSGEIDE
jgi:hypothetical protein